MPYKFQTDNIPMPRDKDRRVKLTDEQREEIKALNRDGLGKLKIAAMYGVSKRLVQFICDPEKRQRNLECRNERGGSAQYYDTEYNTIKQREHRQYKAKVLGVKSRCVN
jgi:hypothetical protein